MTQFDREVWTTRAKSRFKKSSSINSNRAAEKLQLDDFHVSCLEKIVNWCVTRGVQVVFDNQANGTFDFEAKRINVNQKLSPEKQVYVILHECGHFLISDRSATDRFGRGYVSVTDIEKNLVHRIDVVDEELEAWHRGWRLGQRLKLNLNFNKYIQVRSEYILSYLFWATKKES